MINENKYQSVDLLNSNILVALTKLSIPTMLAAFIQMAYNLVDMVWIGKLGYQQVAAVGTAGIFMWFSNGVLALSNIGGQVKFGHSLGRQNQSEARSFVVSTLQLTNITALLYSVFLIVLAPQLIAIFKLNETDTIISAINYLRIVSVGFIFTFNSRIYTSLLTVNGQSKLCLYVTALGLLINIILDPLLIFHFELGAAGAALATILAQAFVLFLFYLVTHKHPLFKKLKLLVAPNWQAFKEICYIGYPPAIQTMFFASIAVVIARMIADFGDAPVSIQKVGTQIESISWMTSDGFSLALTSFIAQNYGAGLWKRVKQGYFKALIIMTCWGIFTTLALVVFPREIFTLFIQDPLVIPGGCDYLRILGYAQLFMCIEIITGATFAGVGKTLVYSTVVTILTLARLPIAYVLMQTELGVNGIWWAISISMFAKGIFSALLFVVYLRRTGQLRSTSLNVADI